MAINASLREKSAIKLQNLEGLADQFGIELPESSSIKKYSYTDEIAKALNDFKGHHLSEVYHPRDADLISACMSLYAPVKFGMT